PSCQLRAPIRLNLSVRPFMTDARLLAVIEVPHDERVRCMADGCGHSVYKRVHIIRRDDALLVYGSTCFARDFSGHEIAKSSPQLTSHAGRVLTAEERQLLVSNTEHLIQRFESEQAAAVAKEKARVIDRPPATTRSWTPPARPVSTPKLPQFTAAERASVEPEARRLLDEKFPGLDFDSPGFTGLLQMEIDRILRGRMA